MFEPAASALSRSVWKSSLVASIAVLFAVRSPPLHAQVVTRVSVDSTGVEGNAASDAPVISADGRFIAFLSTATNFDSRSPGGNILQVFLHDRTTSSTECVSVSSSGVVSDGYCYTPAISRDGRFVAFSSGATNLTAGGGTGFSEIYLRDRVAGTTERVSLPNTGRPQDGSSWSPSISDDGRIVAFSSDSSNLVDIDPYRELNVFVHDRSTNRTELVSFSLYGLPGAGRSDGPSISADGTFVAFSSEAGDLVLGDSNGDWDVFVRDRSTGTTHLASVSVSGGAGNSWSEGSSMSADGSYVAFESNADDLISNDTNQFSDVFVHERLSGVTERVSVDSSGGELNGPSNVAAISDDGSRVSFASHATNVAPADWNGRWDVFLRDRNAGTTALVSVNCAWAAANDDSYFHSISGDGTCVAFSSVATNLVDGDANGVMDVFVNDLAAPPADASWQNYGAGFPGTLGIPTLTAGADPVFGTTFSLDVGNSSGSWSDGLLVVGLQSASIPTSAGGTLLVDPLMEMLIVLMPAGRSIYEHVPRDPTLCGLSLYLQILELDRGAASGISFTPGLQLTIGH